MDLKDLTADTFEPLVGTAFQLGAVEDGVVLTLHAVSRRPAMPGFRPPFSLLFHTAAGTRQTQGTRPLTHPVLGTVELFLVPIQPIPTHARYEAVFG